MYPLVAMKKQVTHLELHTYVFSSNNSDNIIICHRYVVISNVYNNIFYMKICPGDFCVYIIQISIVVIVHKLRLFMYHFQYYF